MRCSTVGISSHLPRKRRRAGYETHLSVALGATRCEKRRGLLLQHCRHAGTCQGFAAAAPPAASVHQREGERARATPARAQSNSWCTRLSAQSQPHAYTRIEGCCYRVPVTPCRMCHVCAHKWLTPYVRRWPHYSSVPDDWLAPWGPSPRAANRP